MRLRLVLGLVGTLLSGWSLAFLPPAVLALVDGGGDVSRTTGYALGAGASLLLGRVLARLRIHEARILRVEAMAVVSLTWLVLTAASAIPFVVAGIDFDGAFFEAMSGLTTTGASVLVDYGAYDRALFLWRAEIQWIGGLGIIALFVAVLPRLGIAGRQMFFAEASGPTEEGLTPQIRRTAGRLWVLYAGLTVVEVALLLWFGMPAFDAVCNAMATLSSGGFSPNASSIAGYHLPACEWVVTAFMFLAGASFTVQYRAFTRGPGGLFRDPEFRVYTALAVVMTAGLAFTLARGVPGLQEWRLASFQIVSLQSTTGFASADFNLWPDSARALVMLALVVGGCAGSSAGGPKIVRYLLLFRHCRRELVRELHPQAVVPLRLGREAVPEAVLRSIVMFVVAYFAVWGAAALALILLGADLVTGFTAALTCLANAGPGLNAVGPMSNFDALPSASKWILSATMWLGRLEILTVVVLCRWDIVRGMTWRRR